MTSSIQAIVDFISSNPTLAAIVIFLVAASEAIAVLGAFVPGTAILIAIGAVVGLGHLSLWPILLAATLGAIAGDGLSYWVGWRYKEQVAAMWPFSRHPDLLQRGEAFFHRHGGKSVVIGRFVPVLRAIIPVVAGMFAMPPLRFYGVNILSALVWAPLHILPGAALGVSFGLLHQISGRLAVAMAILLFAAIATAWLLLVILRRLVPAANRLRRFAVDRIRTWPASRSRTGLLAVLDPDSDGRVLIPLAIAMALFVFGFISLVEDVVARGELARSDAAISAYVQSLRTVGVDTVMVAVTSLGDSIAITAVSAAVALWMIFRRQWRLLSGFLLTLLMATGFATLLKAWIGIPRPIALYEGAQVFSFPSGHATMSATLFGILGFLAYRGVVPAWRGGSVALFGALVGMIAVSRIYLAAHWPSDVAGGLLFGFGMATLFAILFRNVDLNRARVPVLIGTAIVTTVLFGSWHAAATLDRGLKTYAAQPVAMQAFSDATWLETGWRQLPARRLDLAGEGEEAFVLQWAASLPDLQAKLSSESWRPAVELTLGTAGVFLSGRTDIAALPVVPRSHDGAFEDFSLVRVRDQNEREVLRAWRSRYAVGVGSSAKPIYLVSTETERIERPTGFLTVPEPVERSSAAAPLSIGAATQVRTGPSGERVLLAPNTLPEPQR